MSGSASPNFGLLSRPTRVLIAVWFLATLGAGAVGYWIYEHEAGAAITIWTALYHSAQLFILHAPHFSHQVNPALEFARWSAAIFLGGTVLQVARQLFPYEFAALRFRRYRHHVVVGGLGRRALQCVKGERNKPRERRNVVVIDRAPPDDLTRECVRLGAHVIRGNVTDPGVLRAAGIRRAAELWALCPEDSVNVETAMQAERVLAEAPERKGPPLLCNVHLSDVDLRVELQRHAGLAARGAPVNLRFFDLFDREARQVLLHELPIDHDGIGADETRRPHLVILGFGRMGRSVALRAAKLGHFANGLDDPARRLRISVIDRIGPQWEAALLFRYPRFRELVDLTVHPVDLESPAARQMVEAWGSDHEALTSIVVCFDDQSRAVEVALRLLPMLRPDAVRVAVRIGQREGVGSLVERIWAPGEPGVRVRVRTFGRLEEGCCEAALGGAGEERIAQAIHEAFVAERLREGDRDRSDRSMASWENLDEDLRESNRQQADHIAIKLRAIGADVGSGAETGPSAFQFSPTELELLARMEHARWAAERVLAGWTRGPKDIERRVSPYLCDWAELPETIREYDRAAVRAIPDLLARSGMRAERRVENRE